MNRPTPLILLRRLARDESGVQLVEFALSMPIALILLLTGAEMTNFITVKMRISQVALHIADHAARAGSGTLLAAKKIDESQINDIFTGANEQAGKDLDLYTNGRVILTDLEPVTNPNLLKKFKIVWQRCKGNVAYTSQYGSVGDTNLNGIGPTGQLVTSPDDSATMFVEVRYNYQPIIAARWAPYMQITEIASMTVRDRRDLSDDSALGALATHPKGIYKVAGVTASTC